MGAGYHREPLRVGMDMGTLAIIVFAFGTGFVCGMVVTVVLVRVLVGMGKQVRHKQETEERVVEQAEGRTSSKEWN